MRVDIQALTINTHSNCWEILIGQSAAKPIKYNRNVQRLFRKEVHSSEWKRVTPEKGEDIVSSIW